MDDIFKILDSPALKAMRHLYDSPALKALQASSAFTVAKLPTIDISALAALQASSALTVAKLPRIDTSVLATLQASSALTVAKLPRIDTSVLATLQASSAFKAIRAFKNFPFNQSVTNQFIDRFQDIKFDEVSSDATLEAAFDQDAESEILQEYNSSKDFNLLSNGAKNFLLYIYHYYLLPILFICLSYKIPQLESLEKKLQSVNSATEIRSELRKSHLGIDKRLLTRYRVVTGEGLYLRSKPNRRSRILGKLPIGKLLIVIDRSNRSWLNVEVKVDDEVLKGWVFRRYTTNFK